MEIVNGLSILANKVVNAFEQYPGQRVFTVGISGIDASGKGYTTKLLQDDLERRGYKVANINIDPWQRPIAERLRKENAAENIYENIFRWDQFFDQLITPLQNNKSVHLEMKGIRSDDDIYYFLCYDYRDVDIILIDGILLFKKQYLPNYDFKIWIDCGFETGLERAIQRNVEKLDKASLIHDYETYYYPAQRLHFEKDDPQKAADVIYYNDLVANKPVTNGHQ